MIAMSLGLMIIGVVIGIFLSGNRNYAQDERYARIQENARFAMKALMTDIGSAGFWGSMIDLDKIIAVARDSTEKCDADFNGTNPNSFNDTDAVRGIAIASAADIGCITDAKENTIAIATKRVQGQCFANDNDLCPTGLPKDEKVYLHTNGTEVSFIPGDGRKVGGGYRAWQYIPRIYYIRNYSTKNAAGEPDGIPTLVRMELQDGKMKDVPLVEGIENFRVTAGAPSGAEAPLPVQLYILARSLDRDLAYDTNAYDTNPDAAKRFVLGKDALGNDVCFNTTGANDCVALTTAVGTPKHYYRRVFASAVAARNPGLLAQFTIKDDQR